MSPSPHRTAEPTTTRRTRGPRIGLVLLAVAAVPLAGIAGLTAHGVQGARSREHDAAQVADLVRDAVALTKLDGAVFEEMVWSAIDRMATSIDAPPDVVAAFFDADPATELQAARRRTDELLTPIGRPSLTTELLSARAPDVERRQMADRYAQVSEMIRDALTFVRQELANTPRTSTGVLPRSLEALRFAVDARVAVSNEFNAYFSSVFDLRDHTAVELRRLIDAKASFEEAVSALVRIGRSWPSVASSVDGLQSDTDLRAFANAVDELITTSLRDGVSPVPVELTLEAISRHLDAYTTAYRAAVHSSATAMEVLDATAAAVLDASSTDEAAAHHDIVLWYWLSAALALTTMASAYVAARYIVRPLRRLEDAADALRTGGGAPRSRLSGPAEVRTAALALRDAAAHVDLVTRQADALASRNLDAAVLDESAPGGLGVALQHAVANLRAALERQDEFQRRLVHEAAHDGLTRLPNRNASLAHLSRSLARRGRNGSELAVLVIDIDRFNQVNDHHGHHGGDLVLATIARRLATAVREGDHVGRLGGDEFVVVAEPVAGVEEAILLARRILAAIDEPIHLPNAAVRVSASVGVAVADRRLTADELIRDADLAVHRAKESGQATIEVCNEDLHAEIAEVADLQVALRNAIDHDELVVHYQPIIDVHSGGLHAIEALVRWRRPGHAGLVPPDRFIGIAERSSLVIDLDRWVLRAVAEQLSAWAGDAVLGCVPVAVNISGRHLGHDQVVDQLLEPLAQHGIPPRRIVVEVTESALVGDLTGAAAKLHRLRTAGMQVAIDDFGTGYTSLAHLRCLPVDILKIDRSFTLNAMATEQGASIVKLIVDAGHLLGATITAEGIETPAEAARLTELGADHLQGFLYARPAPADEIELAYGQRSRLAG